MSLLIFDKKTGSKEKVKILYQFSKLEKFAPEQGKLGGIAVPYNEKTSDYRLMSFSKGAFKSFRKVPLFINHESWDVRSMIGATDFNDGESAVNFDAFLNLMDDDVTKKIIPLIQMGALEGVSIGAYILSKEDIYDEVTKERIETRITDAEIYELSLVTFQAFESAKIQLEKENDMPKKKTNKPVETENIETVILNEEKIADITEVDEVPAGAEVVNEVIVEETPAIEPSEPTVEDEAGNETVIPSETVVETPAAPVEEVIDETPVVETPAVEVPVQPEVECSKPIVEDEVAVLKKALSEKDAEIAKMKADSIEKEKLEVINELIKSGIIYKVQAERIQKSFKDAESIKEFYKDVPAVLSVVPKGADASEVTSSEVKKELYKDIAKQTSLSEEDFVKYNK